MSLFESTQSKIMIGLAIPVIVLSQKRQFDMTTLLTQLILFLALAYNTDCLVNGRCNVWAWGTLLFPIVMVIGYLFFSRPLDIPSPILIPTTEIDKKHKNI